MDLSMKRRRPSVSDGSSDDECLLNIKKKVEISQRKRVKESDGSEEESVIPGILVKVEVEEVNETDTSLQLPKPKRNVSKTSKSSKKAKEFKCPQCDSAFKYATELKRHSYIHQPETRHKCDVCGRFFNKLYSLRAHSRTHGEPQWKCTECNMIFQLKMSLTRHMRNFHKMVTCIKCYTHYHTQEEMDSHSCGKQIKKENNVSSDQNIDKSNVEDPLKPDEPFTHQDSIKVEIDYDEDHISDENDNDINYSENLITRREDLNEPTQYAIVNKMLKGKPMYEICKLYNITQEVVDELWNDRDKFPIPKKMNLKMTKYMNNVLDNRIIDWFNDKRSKNETVSGKMVLDIAESIAKECGFLAFNGSRKWLDRFKTRYKISFRPTPPKRDFSAFDSKWKKYFFNEQWSDMRFGYKDEEIYHADEIGLFFNSSKDRIKKLAGRKYIHGSVEDRLSIFVCTNCTGTDKKKLLVVGSEDPLIRSYRDPETLPVIYLRHGKAQLTTTMFEQYVKHWNNELVLSNKKAVLIVDRAPIHCKVALSNLKLVLVPWKSAASLMPAKHGIHDTFRTEFRRLILQEKAINVMKGIDRNVTLLEALNIAAKAWDRTPPKIILSSFLTCGYDVQFEELDDLNRPQLTENDEQMICDGLKYFDVPDVYCDPHKLDTYIIVDEELLTTQGNSISVFGGNHKGGSTVEDNKLLPICTEKSEGEDDEKIMRNARALQDLEIVRSYLTTNETSFEMYKAFMDIEKYLMRI